MNRNQAIVKTRNHLLLLFSISIMISCSSTSSKNPKQSIEKQPVRVEVIKAISSAGSTEFQYNGTIEPFRSTPLNFQVTGTIEKVLVEEGDVVNAGDLLATLDQTDLNNALITSKATYEQAMDAYNRLKPVHDNGSLPDIKWVEVTTSLEQAKAMFNIAKNNLNKTSLFAHAAGIIGSRSAETGMSSLQTQPPFTLLDIKKMLVKIAVPEQEIPLVKLNSEAIVTVRALGNQSMPGRVHNIGVSANIVSRTYDVKIVVDNPNMMLRPGMVCDVTLDGLSSGNLIVVPATAITTGTDGKPQVWVLHRELMKVNRRNVVTGAYEGNNIIVLSGIEPGEEVVTAGKEKLYKQCTVAL